MTPTERAELLTDLYALRSHIEAIHQTCAKWGMGLIAVDVSTARENITEAITLLQESYDAKTAVGTSPDLSVENSAPMGRAESNTAPHRPE